MGTERFSAMGDEFRSFVRRFEQTTITTLEHVQDKHFKDEVVEIDGKRFTSCTFENCTLRYSGGDVEFAAGCVVEGNSRPEFSGPARRTVLLCHALGLLSFNPFDEMKNWP
jgi:hypothetical protein